MIDEFRDAVERVITANPTDVKFFKDGVLFTETVRIAHESASVPANAAGPVGLNTSFSMYLLTEWDTAIFENAVLIENGNAWKVNAVDPIKAVGEVYGNRATLTRVEALSDKEITSFSINGVDGIIAGNAIAVTVPAGTDVTALTPAVEFIGETLAPNGPQNFTAPVKYVVAAQDATMTEYTVQVATE